MDTSVATVTADVILPASPGDTPSAAALPAALLSAGDTILLADVVHDTGESQLDDTIAYALRYDLRDSSYLRVASPERVQDALVELKMDGPARIHRLRTAPGPLLHP